MSLWRLSVVLAVVVPLVGFAQSKPKPEEQKKMYAKPPLPEIEKKLTPEQFHVTQKSGTEPPFRNAFWNNHAPGIYVDVVTGEPLFSSADKFDSGTGWPSFVKPLESNIVEKRDSTMGMVRVEVRSKAGDSHLGHLFDDGPRDRGGLRYCINSASLRFVPADKLVAEGYGDYAKVFGVTAAAATGAAAYTGPVAKPGTEVAVLAGGCFWGMEELIRKIPGVLETEAGYTGGWLDNPKYDDTHDSKSGHAESVKVVFDPKKLAYADLLENWFFRMHDPTTKDRQGNDQGTQYRSAIFFTTAQQKEVAEAVIAKVNKSGKWKNPIATQVAGATKWFPAEDYHQDYLQKNPRGYTCHYMRD